MLRGNIQKELRERKPNGTDKPLSRIELQNLEIIFQPAGVNQTDHYMQCVYDAKPTNRK